MERTDEEIVELMKRVEAAQVSISSRLSMACPEEVKATQFCSAPASGGHPAINSWKLRPLQQTALGSLPELDAKLIEAVYGHRDTLKLVLEEFNQLLFDYEMCKVVLQVYTKPKDIEP